MFITEKIRTSAQFFEMCFPRAFKLFSKQDRSLFSLPKQSVLETSAKIPILGQALVADFFHICRSRGRNKCRTLSVYYMQRVLAWIPFQDALCSRALLRVRHARSCLLGGASASNSLTAPVFLVAGRAVATEGVSTVAGPCAYGQCGG